MAWKIGNMPKESSVVGKIAKVTPSVVYLNLGEASGIASNDELIVYRNAEEVIDPDTKKVLTRERQKLAKLQVLDVAKEYSKAKLLGDLELPLAIGDEVELPADKLRIGVFPIEGGTDGETGKILAEQLTTTLTSKGIPVVERALLDKVLAEQLLQNTVLFDEKTAQRIGKQVGATAVLTGRIAGQEAHIRLIEVKSGRVLLAASQKISNEQPKASEKSEALPRMQEKLQRGQVRMPSSKELPGFILARDDAMITKDGLVLGSGRLVRSKDSNFAKRDFVFEITYTFGVLNSSDRRDESVHVGIGDDSNGRGHPKKCIALDIRPTSLQSEGRITLVRGSDGQGGDSERLFGNVRKPGPHRIRIQKAGSELTFHLDVDNDGESVDDLEMTIPDISEHAPFLNEKNSYLYINGGGVFTNPRLTFGNVQGPKELAVGKAAPVGGMAPLGRGQPWPAFLVAGNNSLLLKDGLEVQNQTFVATKRTDFLEKDFTFEVELLFPTWTERGPLDQIVHVAIGEPNPGQSPDRCVYMSIRPPDINDGYCDLGRSAKGTPYGGGGRQLTKLRSRGPHLFRIEKKGKQVTFSVDVGADGNGKEDAELTIPDIAEYAPFLHKKNSQIFFGGGAIFTKVRLQVAD
jgi:FlgO protein